jgi:hypothetical protein
MTDLAPKPAYQSKTFHGLALAGIGWALGFLLPKLGFQHSDIPLVRDCVLQLIDIGKEAVAPAGLIYAAWGRAHAKQPISGVLKAPAQPAEEPPY